MNDEVERKQLGDIDTRGLEVIKAFAGTSATSKHEDFRSGPIDLVPNTSILSSKRSRDRDIVESSRLEFRFLQ